MKKLLTLVLAGLTALPALAEMPLRVATYNIRYDNPGDGENVWANRAERVKSLICFHEFDLVGTQEGLYHQVASIGEMPEYDWIGVGREDGKGKGEFMAIFYRKDRLQLLDNGTFWLSETPDEVSKGWGAQLHRICTWGKFKDLATGEQFYFFNTHLDHRTPEARVGGARLIVERIQSIGGTNPVMCSGDFNSQPGSEPIQIMHNGLKSARDMSVEAPYGPKGTASTFPVGARDLDTAGEIDFIFVNRRINVLKYGVLTDSDAKNFPSDHLPVMIKVEIK